MKTIAYKDKKKIITHESGHVDEYTAADMKKIQDRMRASLNDLNKWIIAVDIQIAQIQAS